LLLVVTDDQRADTLTADAMPVTYRRMVLQGTVYPNFTVPDPLCCPSRAAIMTGRYNHNNGVRLNDVGGLDELSTVQCYLRLAGYRTGIFGKLFNAWPMYPVSRAPLRYRAPLCFDSYAVHDGGRHRGLKVLVGGRLLRPTGYTDDLILNHAHRFLQETERRDRQPWYAYVAPTYPHLPAVARPGHAHDAIPIPPMSDAIGEDVADKPRFIRKHQRFRNSRLVMLRHLRMLRTVDEEMHRLFRQLRRQHELRHTLVIYMSDNGIQMGEHGLWGKMLPYKESVAVPFAMRFPGRVPQGSVSYRLGSNVDILPTILNATNTHPALRYPLDGRSLLARRWSRSVVLNESFSRCFRRRIRVCGSAAWRPAWSSIRTASYQFIEWRKFGRTIAREYYDIRRDPMQLTNLLRDGHPGNDPNVRRLSTWLESLRRCVGAACPGT
jgi:arylsulfatase A-like enzyme